MSYSLYACGTKAGGRICERVRERLTPCISPIWVQGKEGRGVKREGEAEGEEKREREQGRERGEGGREAERVCVAACLCL